MPTMGASAHASYPVQTVLFLAVLVLPTIAIVVQGMMIASRDRQIDDHHARERVADLRRRLAIEVGQEMFAILERIKGQEVANAGASIPQPGMSSDSAAVIVGRTNGRTLTLPWDVKLSSVGFYSRFARVVEDVQARELDATMLGPRSSTARWWRPRSRTASSHTPALATRSTSVGPGPCRTPSWYTVEC